MERLTSTVYPFVPKRLREYIKSKIIYQYGNEPYTRKFYVIGKDESFLDIGANIGFFVNMMAPKCEEVHAWEPSPDTFKILKENTKNLKNVVLHPEAIYDREGEVQFYTHELPALDSIISQHQWGRFKKVIKVRTKTLDNYSFKSRIGLIKMDVEGTEVEAVKGALKTIERDNPRLIIELHPPLIKKRREEIVSLLKKYKWKDFSYPVERCFIIGDSLDK